MRDIQPRHGAVVAGMHSKPDRLACRELTRVGGGDVRQGERRVRQAIAERIRRQRIHVQVRLDVVERLEVVDDG